MSTPMIFDRTVWAGLASVMVVLLGRDYSIRAIFEIRVRYGSNLEVPVKNGKCIKCGSATVHTLVNGFAPGGRREYLGFGGAYSAVDVKSFLCTTSGDYENYFTYPTRVAMKAQQDPA